MPFNALFNRTFHVIITSDSFRLRFLPARLLLLRQRFVIRTFFCVHESHFPSICIHVNCIPSTRTWSRNDFGCPRSTNFINFFHIGLRYCFLPSISMPSTYTDGNNFCSRCRNRFSQFGTFSKPGPQLNLVFSNCLSDTNPASG